VSYGLSIRSSRRYKTLTYGRMLHHRSSTRSASAADLSSLSRATAILTTIATGGTNHPDYIRFYSYTLNDEIHEWHFWQVFKRWFSRHKKRSALISHFNWQKIILLRFQTSLDERCATRAWNVLIFTFWIITIHFSSPVTIRAVFLPFSRRLTSCNLTGLSQTSDIFLTRV